jgi:pentatricopeptide repeat protein
MFNTALSAAGKAGELEVAKALFAEVEDPDAVTYETFIAACGIAGNAQGAESALTAMLRAGHAPRDYAYCGLVAAHSFAGDWRAAMRIRDRMAAAGADPPSVHAYNALIAACDRAQRFDQALTLYAEMQERGVTPNAVTQQLLDGVCKGGVKAVEHQQATIAALSAAVAAAGTVMIRAGIF